MKRGILAVLLSTALFLSPGAGLAFHAVSPTGRVARKARTRINEKRHMTIFVDHMDQHYIYSSDGKRYPLDEKTVVLDLRGRSRARVTTAELFFKGERLIQVVLR